MPASKARKAMRERQLKAAEKEAQRLQEAEIANTEEPDQQTNPSDDPTSKTPKADARAPSSNPTTQNPTSNPKSKNKKKSKSNPTDDPDPPKTKPRFIVFVGKLPFTATQETIRRHFARLEPASIRHLTDKATGKSKGCAFLEFERYDQMKECLKAFHHSFFDDGLGGERRKINIELTVGGGGGKSRERKEKLRAKNDKLSEERHRRAHQRKEAGPGAQRAKPRVTTEEDAVGIHPSRLARMR